MTTRMPLAVLLILCCGLFPAVAGRGLAQEQQPPPLPTERPEAKNRLTADQLLKLLERLVGDDRAGRHEAAAVIGAAPNLAELARDPAVAAVAAIKVVVED
ncbi:MAG: hypothetical protein RDV41_04465, partial [Planctomycetota bacterium]|nr:hypothetical protein [Planctomycetota bacterium]